jgi:hypothetical protein
MECIVTTPRVLLSLALSIGFVVPRSAAADEPPMPPQPPPGELGPPPGYAPPPYQPAAPRYSTMPSGPEEINEFDERRPVPYGYTRVERKRKGLIIGGAVSLGVTYGVSMFAAAVGEDLEESGATHTDVSALWIPVAGPFLQLRETTSSVGKFWVIHLGLAQLAGALMLGYGLTSPKVLLVRNDQLSIAPMIGEGTSGMTVAGRF